MAARHAVVFHDTALWAAVPANNGPNGPAWQWGDELLAGFTTAPFAGDVPGHQCRPGGPFESALARSLDGGMSWITWTPRGYAGQPARPVSPPGGIDFTTPGFALRVEGHGYHGNDGEHWFASLDRGASWDGPFGLGSLLEDPRLREMQLTGRTAYLVTDAQRLDLFLSARKKTVAQGLKVAIAEKPFLARTEDGGRTFRFVSWLVGWDDPARAVMPAPVRLDSRRIVVAVRRKSATNNWIDCYGTADDGATWTHRARLGDTERASEHNGNPPALVATGRGRLCAVWGNRTERVLLARWSDDAGQTWGSPTVLRSDFHSANGWPDLGYPRLYERLDGELVVVYFWCTATRPQTHIAATIFGREG